jgi:hypothetical protein
MDVKTFSCAQGGHDRLAQIGNILSSLSKGWDVEDVVRHSVIEISANLVCGERLIKGPIHRRDEATVDAPEGVRADRSNTTLLNQIEEANLNFWRKFIEFIQKECALMRLDRQPGSRFNCSGECPFDVSEELTLSEVSSPKVRRSVHKPTGAAGGALMEQTSTQSFTRACFS